MTSEKLCFEGNAKELFFNAFPDNEEGGVIILSHIGGYLC